MAEFQFHPQINEFSRQLAQMVREEEEPRWEQLYRQGEKKKEKEDKRKQDFLREQD